MAFSVPLASAQTLTEENVENRLLVLFQANAAAVQKRLPPDLEVAPFPQGPFKDANLMILLSDRALQQDGSGKTVPGETRRGALVAAAVKSRTTGKAGTAVLRGFNPSEEQLPTFYKNGVAADIRRVAATTCKGAEPTSVKDEWDVKTRTGDVIHVEVEYTRGVPLRAQRDYLIFSAAQPNLFRIYKTDELVEMIRSVPAKIDRASKLEYRVSIADMNDLFGQDAHLVGAFSNPVMLRKVFVPEQSAAK